MTECSVSTAIHCKGLLDRASQTTNSRKVRFHGSVKFTASASVKFPQRDLERSRIPNHDCRQILRNTIKTCYCICLRAISFKFLSFRIIARSHTNSYHANYDGSHLVGSLEPADRQFSSRTKVGPMSPAARNGLSTTTNLLWFSVYKPSGL